MPSYRGYSADAVNNQCLESTTYRRQSPLAIPTTQPPKQATHASRVEKKDNQGDFSVRHVTVELARKIQAARQARGWTQKDLARHAQVPLDIVRNYENASAVVNGNYTSKLRRILKV
jgi:putative transcription factor